MTVSTNGFRTATCPDTAPFVAHDRRGCRRVCQAHADFLAGTSMMMGHSPDCPAPPPPNTKWARITRL
jgi:hypothetical protein